MAPAQQSTTAPHKSRAARVLPAIGLAAALASFCLPVQAQAGGPPARGFIVKLKNTAAAASIGSTTEKAQAARNHMAEVAARRRVSYLSSRPTALDGAQVLNYGRWLSAAEAKAEADRLRSDPDVEWVMVNSLEKRLAVATPPTDPLYVATAPAPIQWVQWWLRAPGGQIGIPGIPAAWDVLANHALTPVVTAVLDSGVRGDHPDLAGQLLDGYDFVSEYDHANDGNALDPDPTDPGDWVSDADKNASASFGADCEIENSSWHGTHIAGQLAARVNNNTGVAGMLWQLQDANTAGAPVVLPVRVAGKCGALVNDIIEGMYWAAGISYPNSPPLNPHPARIISLSFGSATACNSAESGAYIEAINKLAEAGVLVVAAAGNGAGNDPGSASASRPANCSGVLGVTAVNRDGSKAYYANLITSVGGIATVGGDATTAQGSSSGIASTSNAGTTTPVAYDSDGYYEYKAGTSFAAPIVAGVAAMMLSIEPRLTPQQLITGLTGQATAWPGSIAGVPQTCDLNNRGLCRCTTTTCGLGLLNASAAVTYAAGATPGFLTLPLSSNGAVAPGTVTSAYQTARGSSTPRPRSNGDGGGGAVQPAWLAGLVLAIGALAARRRG